MNAVEEKGPIKMTSLNLKFTRPRQRLHTKITKMVSLQPEPGHNVELRTELCGVFVRRESICTGSDSGTL